MAENKISKRDMIIKEKDDEIAQLKEQLKKFRSQ